MSNATQWFTQRATSNEQRATSNIIPLDIIPLDGTGRATNSFEAPSL